MEAEECLKSFLTVNQIGISTDTLLSNSLLQMIRFSINEYRIEQLHNLTRIFFNLQQKSSKNNIIEAIMLAMPFVLHNRIKNKELNFENPSTLLLCLEMFAHLGVDRFPNSESLYLCLNCMKKELDRLSKVEIMQLLPHMYSLNSSDSDCNQLINRISSRCIDDILAINKEDRIKMPTYLFRNILKQIKRHSFYDEKLFRLFKEYALDSTPQNFTNKDLYKLLLHNWIHKYVDYDLLNHFGKLLENRDQSILIDEIDPTLLFKFFTASSHYEKININFLLVAQNIISSDPFMSMTNRSSMAYFDLLKSCLILNVSLTKELIWPWFDKYLQSAYVELNTTSKRFDIIVFQDFNFFNYLPLADKYF